MSSALFVGDDLASLDGTKHGRKRTKARGAPTHQKFLRAHFRRIEQIGYGEQFRFQVGVA